MATQMRFLNKAQEHAGGDWLLAPARRAMIFGAFAVVAAGPVYADDGPSWEPLVRPVKEPVGFIDVEGRARDLSEFRGRAVLLNLWASWCAPCVLELPALDRLQRDLGGGLTILPLSIDRGGMAEVVDAYRRLKLRSLPQFVDQSGQALLSLGAQGLPATFAVSKSGVFLGSRRGAVDWDSPVERSRLKHILMS